VKWARNEIIGIIESKKSEKISKEVKEVKIKNIDIEKTIEFIDSI